MSFDKGRVESGNELITNSMMRKLSWLQYDNPGNILFRYMSRSTSYLIKQGRQLRLTRCDVLFGKYCDRRGVMDEAIETIANIISCHGIPQSILDDAIEKVRNLSDDVVFHRIRPGEYIECIPYAVCFTPLDRRYVSSELENDVVNRDVCIEFCTQDMGLDIPKIKMGLNGISYDPDMVVFLNADVCEYREQIFCDYIDSTFVTWIETEGTDSFIDNHRQSIVDFITECICTYWLSYANPHFRRQSRLIAYVPKHEYNLCSIDFVHGPRLLSDTGEWFEGSSDDIHVYLNFKDDYVFNIISRPSYQGGC